MTVPGCDLPRPLRLAVVVQRYGLEVNGGAELHARWLAERLLALGSVDVFTTCAVDYHTWADHYPPGVGALNGVTVRRFPVDAPRHWQRAQRLTGQLLRSAHALEDQLTWLRAQGPISTPLLQALHSAADAYDAFIFFTFLYATTALGLPLVADKALLVPTAHDDPFLRLEVFRPVFHLPRAILYNTAAEQRLVHQVTGNQAVPSLVVGIGVNVPSAVDAQRFRREYGLSGDFLLYVGRIDESKNVPALFDDFLRYRAAHPRPLQLVLAGKAHIPLPNHPDIRPIGFISEQAKFDGLRAATAVVVPSRLESLSMLTLEAWLMETPTLVNGACDVLKEQTRQSNGGLYYESAAEFDAALTRLLEAPDLCAALGRQGARFVSAAYNWPQIVIKYCFALRRFLL